METSTLGASLKKHRKIKGMTQSHLAELCGLAGGRQIIQKYESDIVKPTVSTLEKLCKVLGLEISLVGKNNFAETLDI